MRLLLVHMHAYILIKPCSMQAQKVAGAIADCSIVGTQRQHGCLS